MTTRLSFLVVSLLLTGALGAEAQTPRTGRLMREKLLHAQRILAGLTTSDQALLMRETLALTKITESPTWTDLMTGDLRPYAGDLTKPLADLSAAAGRRDYDVAAASYRALISACMDCHKHVMNRRIARAP